MLKLFLLNLGTTERCLFIPISLQAGTGSLTSIIRKKRKSHKVHKRYETVFFNRKTPTEKSKKVIIIIFRKMFNFKGEVGACDWEANPLGCCEWALS